mmetsp:Transcript_10629/g.22342  ORF Transcript_10629/g.22342 Transcript_10629/m.22342 type:complete len:158 (-) Transcript_10629:148-621(-)
MPLYHSVIITLAEMPKREVADMLKKSCHTIFDNGGWVRAAENHGVRDLPYRMRSPYSSEEERYQKSARYLSLYFDAHPNTKGDMELALRLNEKVLRFNTFRQYSVADEVRSLQRKNVWNEVAGVEVEPRAPKQKKSAWMDDDAKSEAELAEFIQRHF